MTPRPTRPSEWNTLGDHEQRIRILEADPGCCAGGDGYDQAIAIRDRACHWYGLGDGFTTDMSVVKDYGIEGTDAELIISSEAALEDGTPGTIGESVEVTHPWPIAQDNGSFQGFLKDFCNFGGYAPDPYVNLPGGAIGTTGDWTINVWVRFDGFPMICHGSGIVSYGTTGFWGFRNSSNVGIWLGVDGETVLTGDPAPDPVLSLNLNTGDGMGGVNVHKIEAGILEVGRWYMVTAVYADSSIPEILLYVDGGLIGSLPVDVGTGISGSVPGVGSVNFGGFTGTSYGTMNGCLSGFGMWVGDCAEALDGGEVAILYDAGAAPTPVPASQIDSGDADCGQPLVADGDGGATWGNPCADTGVFQLPNSGSVTVQDVVDALVAMGLVTQL